ncbi:MAG: hypothetical protein Q9176_000735 [Flavoplaca citrina]
MSAASEEEAVKTQESLDMDIFERMYGGPSTTPSAGTPAAPVAGPPGPASVAPSATPSGTATVDVLRARRQDFLAGLAPGGGVALPGNYRAPRPVVPAPNVQPPDTSRHLVATANVASRLICTSSQHVSKRNAQNPWVLGGLGGDDKIADGPLQPFTTLPAEEVSPEMICSALPDFSAYKIRQDLISLYTETRDVRNRPLVQNHCERWYQVPISSVFVNHSTDRPVITL